MFWAEQGVYRPCGMFTKQHVVIILICLAILSGLFIYSRRMTGETVNRLVRLLGILLCLLELVKIFYNLSYGYTWIDAWLPIAYCFIFLYALLLSSFAGNSLKQYGDAYLSGVSIVAGAAYLIAPSTSLMFYPVCHYLSLHSMVFHTMMIYVGVLYLWRLHRTLNWKVYVRYVILFAGFAGIALLCNAVSGSNLMQLREPSMIPVRFLHTLYARIPWGYTLFVLAVYLVVPYAITYGVDSLIRSYRNRRINIKMMHDIKNEE